MAEVVKMWLTARDFAERYQLSYRAALEGAKSGRFPGHWQGNRFMFNAARCDRMYESGELDEALNAIG